MSGSYQDKYESSYCNRLELAGGTLGFARLAGCILGEGTSGREKQLGWVQQPEGWTFKPKQLPLITFPEDSVLVIVTHPKHFT